MTDKYRKHWQDKTDAGHRYHDESWFKKLAEELLHLFPVRGTLLDVGCGNAEILTYLAPHFDKVIGIDISDSMLTEAEKRAKQFGISNIRFAQADACQFPEFIDKADLVLSYQLIQHLDEGEISRHLQECRRVLSPKGMIGMCSILWANLKYLFRAGGLRSKPLSPFNLLIKYHQRIPRKAISWLRHGVYPADIMGFWHTHDQVKFFAAREGFDCEIVNSWYYEYRFHAILNHRGD